MKKNKTEVEEILENFANWILLEYNNNNLDIFYKSVNKLVRMFMTGGK